ncbi:MAG TPA: hypothetical protein VK978_00025 [Candidatus Saccharimonadales bacterium]|nr:hypothetical protein [Candidatus Saccharimonadales bacterium]
MALFMHVLVALSSLVYAGYTFYGPSKKKLRASYVLVVLTLISGTYLVVSTHSPLLTACTTGLIYLTVVLSGLAAAQRKLSIDKSQS